MTTALAYSNPIDLNTADEVADIELIRDSRNWIDVREFKTAAAQVDTAGTSATTYVLEVVYSIDGVNEQAFTSAAEFGPGSSNANAVTVDVSDVPFIRIQVKTAEGSALTGTVALFLANLDIP